LVRLTIETNALTGMLSGNGPIRTFILPVSELRWLFFLSYFMSPSP
jgi:hypothetical protein